MSKEIKWADDLEKGWQEIEEIFGIGIDYSSDPKGHAIKAARLMVTTWDTRKSLGQSRAGRDYANSELWKWKQGLDTAMTGNFDPLREVLAIEGGDHIRYSNNFSRRRTLINLALSLSSGESER